MTKTMHLNTASGYFTPIGLGIIPKQHTKIKNIWVSHSAGDSFIQSYKNLNLQ